MKASIILVCIISCCCINSVHAQGYKNKFGVENLYELNDEQLMECYSNARTSSISGGVFVVGGVGLMLGGLAVATMHATEEFLNYFSSSPSRAPANGLNGSGLFISGIACSVGGAALCISGNLRKKHLSPVIKSRGLISDISVHAGAEYALLTDTYYPSITFRIAFK